MAAEGVSAAKTAADLLRLAHKEGWLDQLRTLLQRKHRVLVLGSTGAGKTNLLESLTVFVPEALDAMNRTEFSEEHRIKVSGEPFVFVDTPGQELHRSRRIEAVRRAVGDGIAGVINVTAFGYHEYRTGRGDAVAGEGTVSEDYLETHRQIEIDALGEWTELLGDRATTGWLITVVTKADLWWNRRDAVIDHYQKGVYYKALGPAQALHPVVLPYCSVFKKFFDAVPMSGVFDDADRLDARIHLFEALIAAIGKSRPWSEAQKR